MTAITDQQRLDFLQEQLPCFDAFFRQRNEKVYQVLDSLDGQVLGEGMTIRQAIDDAMTSPVM